MKTPHQFWKKVDVRGPEECWPWLGRLNECGNAQWYWRGELRLIHHIAVELCFGVAIPRRTRSIGSRGMIVRHSCDLPHCANPFHLLTGTQLQNVRDMISRGRACRGSRHPKAKLNETIVRRIRRRFTNGGVMKRELAEENHIDPSAVSRIISNKIWKNV